MEKEKVTPLTKVFNDFHKFFDENELKFHLTCASLYLAAYEILKHSIAEKTKDFHSVGFDGTKCSFTRAYKDIRKLDKNIVVASALWLKDQDVISEEDVENVKIFRNHRNDIAHELPNIIIDSSFDINFSHFKKMEQLHKKIIIWWFKVEWDMNPAFDSVSYENIDIDNAVSWITVQMNHIVNIAATEVEKRPIIPK